MNDLPVIIIITAFALGYVSLLLAVRLSSAGIGRRRIGAAIAEVWATFALVIAAFATIRAAIGAVPEVGIAGEWSLQAARLAQLSPGVLVAVAGALLAAVGLFAHLLLTLRGVGQAALAAPDAGAEGS